MSRHVRLTHRGGSGPCEDRLDHPSYGSTTCSAWGKQQGERCREMRSLIWAKHEDTFTAEYNGSLTRTSNTLPAHVLFDNVIPEVSPYLLPPEFVFRGHSILVVVDKSLLIAVWLSIRWFEEYGVRVFFTLARDDVHGLLVGMKVSPITRGTNEGLHFAHASEAGGGLETMVVERSRDAVSARCS